MHEAAGHAPIIIDQEYADYCSALARSARKNVFDERFPEVCKRSGISVLKEQPNPDARRWRKQQAHWRNGKKNLGDPSEVALLRASIGGQSNTA